MLVLVVALLSKLVDVLELDRIPRWARVNQGTKAGCNEPSLTPMALKALEHLRALAGIHMELHIGALSSMLCCFLVDPMSFWWWPCYQSWWMCLSLPEFQDGQGLIKAPGQVVMRASVTVKPCKHMFEKLVCFSLLFFCF